MRSSERAGVDIRFEKVDIVVAVPVAAVVAVVDLSPLSLRVCDSEIEAGSLSFRFWFLLNPRLYDAHGSNPAEILGPTCTGVSGVSYSDGFVCLFV